MQQVQDNDMILCRINAPLVKVCYSLIKQGKKATIVGRDIGKGLIALIDRLKPWDINDLLVKLNDYKFKEIDKLEKAGRESQAEAIKDKCDTLVALTDGVNDLTTLKARIEKIFTDQISGISLSSVHRAKGLEADNIYVLKPHLMPFPKATKDWEVEQERNVMYVALTRAKKKLAFVEGEAPVWYDPSEVEQEFAPTEDQAS
jgi:superfamily I DNA/RNA helicase